MPDAVTALAFHRNGISGDPFWVATIQTTKQRFVVIRFVDKDMECPCAVLDIDLLAKGDIAFGSNSWRGDNYIALIDAAIAEREKTYAAL